MSLLFCVHTLPTPYLLKCQHCTHVKYLKILVVRCYSNSYGKPRRKRNYRFFSRVVTNFRFYLLLAKILPYVKIIISVHSYVIFSLRCGNNKLIH